MAFLMIRIEVPNGSVADLNTVISNGDSTKPSVTLSNLADLIAGINSRTPGANVSLAVRETTQTISADGSGVTVAISKL